VAPLPLPLRNRLAELILEAFEPGEARATVLALARACDSGDATSDPAEASRLLDLGWFESLPGGQIRLRGVYRAHGADLAERASRAASVVRDWADPPGQSLVTLLERTEALATHGLYFEVHELLEPAWFRAPEPTRTALQGLIQVAVAFHHLENGNREGARSLLTLGVAKVADAGSALPLDARGWLDGLRVTLAALSRGQDPPPAPRWPRPRRPTS